MVAGVFSPQNLGLNSVLGRIGGGFRSSGGAGGRGFPSEGGAIAAWKAPSDELGGLAALQGVPLKVRRHPGPTCPDGTVEVGCGVTFPDHLGEGGLDLVEDISVQRILQRQGKGTSKELGSNLGDVGVLPQVI